MGNVNSTKGKLLVYEIGVPGKSRFRRNIRALPMTDQEYRDYLANNPGLQATYKDTTGKSRVEIKHRDLFSPEQLLEQEKKHPAILDNSLGNVKVPRKRSTIILLSQKK